MLHVVTLVHEYPQRSHLSVSMPVNGISRPVVGVAAFGPEHAINADVTAAAVRTCARKNQQVFFFRDSVAALQNFTERAALPLGNFPLGHGAPSLPFKAITARRSFAAQPAQPDSPFNLRKLSVRIQPSR